MRVNRFEFTANRRSQASVLDSSRMMALIGALFSTLALIVGMVVVGAGHAAADDAAEPAPVAGILEYSSDGIEWSTDLSQVLPPFSGGNMRPGSEITREYYARNADDRSGTFQVYIGDYSASRNSLFTVRSDFGDVAGVRHVYYGSDFPDHVFGPAVEVGTVLNSVELAPRESVKVKDAVGLHEDASSSTEGASVRTAIQHRLVLPFIEPTPIPTVTVTLTPTPSPSPTVTTTVEVTLTPSPAPTVTTTVTAAPTFTPTVTVTPSATTTVTAAPTSTPTVTVTPSATTTVTAAPTSTPTVTVTPSSNPVDIYLTPGFHEVGGRRWHTSCEPYSATTRCTTEIWGTQINFVDGAWVQKTGWLFNDLTYAPTMTRAQWASNPLGHTGQWTATGGRNWRTECDTELTGRDACRSYAWVSYGTVRKASDGSTSYVTTSGWVLNNMVRFKR